MYVEPEAVSLWVDLIRLIRILKLLKYFPRTDAPSLILHTDEGRRVIVRLE